MSTENKNIFKVQRHVIHKLATDNERKPVAINNNPSLLHRIRQQVNNLTDNQYQQRLATVTGEEIEVKVLEEDKEVYHIREFQTMREYDERLDDNQQYNSQPEKVLVEEEQEVFESESNKNDKDDDDKNNNLPIYNDSLVANEDENSQKEENHLMIYDDDIKEEVIDIAAENLRSIRKYNNENLEYLQQTIRDMQFLYTRLHVFRRDGLYPFAKYLYKETKNQTYARQTVNKLTWDIKTRLVECVLLNSQHDKRSDLFKDQELGKQFIKLRELIVRINQEYNTDFILF